MTASFLNFGWPITLLDAAARSLLMAAAVAAGLRLLRVSNVRARKAAWVLVLTGAMIMPVLAPWAESQALLPIESAVVPVRTWLAKVASWGQTSTPLSAARLNRGFAKPPSFGKRTGGQVLAPEQAENAAML